MPARRSERAPRDDRPTDLQITAAMRETEAKHAPVNCVRYRARVDLANPADADAFVTEMIASDLIRISSDIANAGVTVDTAQHPVLRRLSRPKPWYEFGKNIGLEVHIYVVGPQLTIDCHGTAQVRMGDLDQEYSYQIKPLAQMQGKRLSALWGQDGLPGTYSSREDKCTRMVIRILQHLAGSEMAMGGQSLPLLEVRNIKIGELDGRPVFGFCILAYTNSLAIRLANAHSDLRDLGLEQITLSDYRERLEEANAAGNQELDEAEAATSGRKYMIWAIPFTCTTEHMSNLAQEYFGELFESCVVTISAQLHPYAWIILTENTHDARMKACDFEPVLQSKWGAGVSLAASKTRQDRIRMASAHRDKLDQRDGLNAPKGQLKEIIVPKKAIQDALLEPAFMDIWVDSLYSRIGPKLAADVSLNVTAAIEVKVQEMVNARVESEMAVKMADFSAQVVDKVLKTIDAAVDFAMTRALEARVLEMGDAAFDPGAFSEPQAATEEQQQWQDKLFTASQLLMETTPIPTQPGDPQIPATAQPPGQPLSAAIVQVQATPLADTLKLVQDTFGLESGEGAPAEGEADEQLPLTVLEHTLGNHSAVHAVSLSRHLDEIEGKRVRDVGDEVANEAAEMVLDELAEDLDASRQAVRPRGNGASPGEEQVTL